MIHITPSRVQIMPKEKTRGHRALRHPHFRGADDFCLVHLRPDSPNKYFNANPEMVQYFRSVFQSGIELAGQRYHLFGTSNSQLKAHAYWFIRAASLDEIDEKRRQLGEFHRINNLGTYVARLALWFSSTDSTGVRDRVAVDAREWSVCLDQTSFLFECSRIRSMRGTTRDLCDDDRWCGKKSVLFHRWQWSRLSRFSEINRRETLLVSSRASRDDLRLSNSSRRLQRSDRHWSSINARAVLHQNSSIDEEIRMQRLDFGYLWS